MTRGLLKILCLLGLIAGLTPIAWSADPQGPQPLVGSIALAKALPSAANRTLAAFNLSARTTPSDQADPSKAASRDLPMIEDPMSQAQFLDAWQRRCFRFLWEQADPRTGLVADRAPADGSERGKVASIAATGFGLTGICIADQRGWVDHDQAYQRVLTTLKFLYHEAPQKNGFFYHFMNGHTGKRVWNCEVSSVDTALLMAGVITAGEYYSGTQVHTLAQKLYARVDWPWMLNGGRTLSLGWSPEDGFLNIYWDSYSEHLILQILGLGSPTHPLPPKTWDAWRRAPLVKYNGSSFLSYPPLFVHQFSQAWIDFRGKRDDYADYWTNSVLATRAQRQMCIALKDKFPNYGKKLWGITSSDAEFGYTAWGGPEPSANIDGTVVPCAAGGSMPFLPREASETVYYMYTHYGQNIWKHYGLVDAFNPESAWQAKDVIGIDAGIVLLMIENNRSEFVWNQFMQSPDVQRAMEIADFRRYQSKDAFASHANLANSKNRPHASEAANASNASNGSKAANAEASGPGVADVANDAEDQSSGPVHGDASEDLAQVQAIQKDPLTTRHSSVFEQILSPPQRSKLVKTLQVPRRLISAVSGQADSPSGDGDPSGKSARTTEQTSDHAGSSNAQAALDKKQAGNDQPGMDLRSEINWHSLTLGDALEVGRGSPDQNLKAQFAFSWDDQALHLRVNVHDRNVKAADQPQKLYKQDLVELFIDPDNDGLIWNNPADFQFGFGVTNRVWEWFGNRQNINARVTRTGSGYEVRADIPFSLLRIDPAPGTVIGASVAVQSMDQKTHRPLKLNWSWQPHIKRIYLGQLQLADAR